jgi:hypothetical protein
MVFDELVKNSPLVEIPNKIQFLKAYPYYETSDDSYLYFLKVVKYRISDNISPLEFVKDDIRNIILNKRKVELAKKWKMMFITMQQVRKNLRFLSRLQAVTIATLCLLTIAGVQAQENEGFVVDKIIGKVDNYIVTKSELDKAYLDYVSNGGKGGDQTRCQFLAMLLRNKLMMAKAEIDSVVVSDDEVDQTLNEEWP